MLEILLLFSAGFVLQPGASNTDFYKHTPPKKTTTVC